MNDVQAACPECGDRWLQGQTCADAFHLLLGWEWEHQMQAVHHLLVLSYHLQHPSLYSPEGLTVGRALLIAFVEDGVTPETMRKRIGRQVDSGARTDSLTARPDRYGIYEKPVVWTMRIGDCVRAGPDPFYASVRAWAASILASLRASGNLDGISAQSVLK
jgi:hypothetical protein